MSIPVADSPRDTDQASRSGDIAGPAADLLRAVAEAHGLPTPFAAQRLAGGYANDVEVGAALSRLHAVQLDMDPRPGHLRLQDLPVPPLRPMPPEFDSWLPLIADARAETIETISRIASTRRVTVGVTQNDILPGNVLIDDGQVTALLDWEEADIDWLVWDLASSISPFCSTADGDLDMSAKQDFLRSCHSSDPSVAAAKPLAVGMLEC
jgi:Ser/Thr protein kinase RdoA (MazF antagonist)